MTNSQTSAKFALDNHDPQRMNPVTLEPTSGQKWYSSSAYTLSLGIGIWREYGFGFLLTQTYSLQ